MSAGRSFVIGDVHGCLDEVCRLLDALAPTSDDTLCWLGDYLDRGPDPRGVVERLIRLRGEGPRCVFLKGNHEDMFLAFLGLGGRHGEAFLWNGGDATLASYGLDGMSGAACAERLPPAHHEFLRSLQTHARVAGCLCVHAGVRPTRPLNAQLEEDLLWIREDFLGHPHPFECTVLFGHTPHRDVLLDLPYKVGLDTGLVYGNRLSCLEVESSSLWQIERGARQVTRRGLGAALQRGNPA
ncbi:MAG: metallophosphoesterase family protein [Deltaproteobacteria bacterium]|nr:metallophosphoesterase family protein [Deltaproteobacteria bacterium]